MQPIPAGAGSTLGTVTHATALDTLAKAQANSPFDKPGVEEALNRHWQQRKLSGPALTKPLGGLVVSPEAHARFVKVSGAGLAVFAERLQASGTICLSEQFGAQFAANIKASGIADQFGAQFAANFKASGIADQFAEQWRGHLQEIMGRSGINAQLTATMREGLANLYTSFPASTTWDIAASTAATLRPIGQEALGSVIEVVSDDLADGPSDAVHPTVDLIQRSAVNATVGWTFVLAMCEPYGPPDLSPEFQGQVTRIVAAWAFFGIILPGMMRLASNAFRD
jgi:hypothetical protein